jgi:hypothetical protein
VETAIGNTSPSTSSTQRQQQQQSLQRKNKFPKLLKTGGRTFPSKIILDKGEWIGNICYSLRTGVVNNYLCMQMPALPFPLHPDSLLDHLYDTREACEYNIKLQTRPRLNDRIYSTTPLYLRQQHDSISDFNPKHGNKYDNSGVNNDNRSEDNDNNDVGKRSLWLSNISLDSDPDGFCAASFLSHILPNINTIEPSNLTSTVVYNAHYIYPRVSKARVETTSSPTIAAATVVGDGGGGGDDSNSGDGDDNTLSRLSISHHHSHHYLQHTSPLVVRFAKISAHYWKLCDRRDDPLRSSIDNNRNNGSSDNYKNINQNNRNNNGNSGVGIDASTLSPQNLFTKGWQHEPIH